jgi:urea carboxylase
MFKKVLIANRGAIAVRVARTLRQMGVRSAAVYTKADLDSLHIQSADEAVCIGNGPAKTSYLDAELILKTARDVGADAIHPGYGFLSENAELAAACARAGLVFIGPRPEQMRAFGLKHQARALAQKAGVPLLPGSELLADLAAAKIAAQELGYPVMLKSTAGGGGIGMRVCSDAAALSECFEQVSYLAKSNFKDSGLFLEKYISQARHIEVQIFGQKNGKVIVVGDRDCSVQRRNQKVIEESPAPQITDAVRAQLHQAARALAQEAGYENAGTVEFLYAVNSEKFYFLEVNARLQVEHGVTEETAGVDLVEWMVREAAGENPELRDPVSRGCSIQARVYAEDALLDFRPSSGKITKVIWPDKARVETWVRDNLTVPALYDPLLAKIIVRGADRTEAIRALQTALAQTKIYGVTTNVNYLLSFTRQTAYQEGALNTALLKNFLPEERALEVLDGGIQTTVQDYPGIVGYWPVGVPPCGPMDNLSFRVGNKLLGNAPEACGLELTLRGGRYKFRGAAQFCLTGADMNATLDNKPVERYKVLTARPGQTLEFGETTAGMRAYLLVRGGFDIPQVLNSRSTFTLGNFGGHGGRALRSGDVLGILPAADAAPLKNQPPAFTNEWEIGLIPGPHCTPEFLQDKYLDTLTAAKWKVHFNSSRTGVRLIGPTPEWARADGGEAGLHPSNIHDTAYAVGTLDLTGDMPILLGPDGPSLGGFVCPATTASAELWKLGQLHPGDKVTFRLLTIEQAAELQEAQNSYLENLADVPPQLPERREKIGSGYPILARENRETPFTVRCAGDNYLLAEYGEMTLDIVLRFKVYALEKALAQSGLPIIEMTPAIRSLQIHIDTRQMPLRSALKKILDLERALPSVENIEVPSRKIKLPLSWNDPAIQLAVERYHKNVRPDAPWCPSNIEFIRRINGLASADEVQKIIFAASYLVVGLGDVYLGAPLTISLDPRHQLVTTKYNPARTWTPENAVGIGGAYMCVYGMEGPGGYQLFGRTVQMWNSLQSTQTFQPGKPWALEFFDQIQFYPVSAAELLQMREDFLRGRFELQTEKTVFNLGEYLRWLKSIKDSARAFKQKQQAAFQKERQAWQDKGLDKFVSENENAETAPAEVLASGQTAVNAPIAGVVWKINAAPGQKVQKGETLVIEESMKMEIAQTAPRDGLVEKICVALGAQVTAGQLLLVLK